MNPDHHPLTLLGAAKALESGQSTAQELAENLVARIEAQDGGVRAFLHLDRNAILAQACRADERRKCGHAKSRFDGVPVAVKDNLAVTGQPCTCASRILEGYVSPYDATAVAKLREGGFVLCGRTNMDEFAMGSSTEHSGFHPTANPCDLTRVPGGSSGGSAAAVAAGTALAALGSDTGGSIRQPASFCGVVGLKPTYGRVSRYGLVAFASSLDQIGPIGQNVADCAVLLDVISGHDPMDSTSLPQPPPTSLSALAHAELRGVRIGLPAEYFEVKGLDPDVRAAVNAAAHHCERQGATLVDVRLPHTPYAVAAYYIIATAEASTNLARFDGIRYGARDREAEATDLLETYRQTRANGFGDEVKRRIILGTYVLSSGYYDAYYLRAQKVRTLVRQDFEAAFQKCDLVLSPTAPTPAFRRGEITDPLEMYLADIYTLSANLAGFCAISLPCGQSPAGLPIGVQLMAPPLGEQHLLQAAAAYERTTAHNL